MKPETDTHEKKGLYFGTEINESWWKRYRKDRMFARGNGTWWIDSSSFYFLRYLTKRPISIPFKDMTGFKTGKWHAGRWGNGKPILKILWTRNDLVLCSGFSISTDTQEVIRVIDYLNEKVNAAAKKDG